MGSTYEHQKLVDEILFDIGSLPEVRAWIRVVGYDELKRVRYGIVGEADIQGIISPTGKMLYIEVKTGDAKMSKEQERRFETMERFGALCILARNRQEVLAQIQEAVRLEGTRA